jgi:small GTP-binding protein
MSDEYVDDVQPTTAASCRVFKPRAAGSPGIQIWDTAGMEQFQSLNSLYYRNAMAAILVFDITSRRTFESLTNWYNEFIQNSSSKTVFVAANKTDLLESREAAVSKPEIRAWCADHHAVEFFVSARFGDNVRQMFITIGDKLPEVTAPTAIEILQVGEDSDETEQPSTKCC